MLRVGPLPGREAGGPLAYSIGRAGRNGEPRWRARIDRFITDHAREIHAILVAANAFGRYFPLLITAAVTAKPANVRIPLASVACLVAHGTDYSPAPTVPRSTRRL